MPPKSTATGEKPKAKSSPTRSKLGKTNSGEGKKFSSLTSFQPTLNFTALPTPSSKPSSSSSTSSTSAPARLGSTSSSKGKEKAQISNKTSSNSDSSGNGARDSKLMPPPPAGLKTKSRLAAATAKPAPLTTGWTAKSGIGKGKPVVYELEDSDDEDIPSSSSRKGSTSKHTGMWADVYLPKTESDLAPSKTRIVKVKNWLNEALYGYPEDAPAQMKENKALAEKIRKYRRILLLTGPAGAGKTTTIRVLAKDMGIDLMEWGEGAEEWSMGGSSMDRESSISKFSSFLSRNTYAPLTSSTSSSSQQPVRPRILFLTALPNISHNATKEAFHASLRDFCKSYSASSCPMIIVHSEVGNSGAAEESWRDRERGGRDGVMGVLGKEVKEGPWCTEIEFLPVAPTFQIKALKKVMENAVAVSPFTLPTVASVQLLALSSNGDLRSAVNSLQMLCMRIRAEGKKRKDENDDSGPAGKKRKLADGVVAKGKGSRGGKGAKLNVPTDIRAVLDALTRKEQSLHLFHALGRVLYNKRLGDPATDNDDQSVLEEARQLPPDDPLPTHLNEFERRKSLVQMEAFVGSIPIDSSSFTLWLHQSIPSFCSTIDQASMAADEMCSADIMRTDDDIWQSSQQAISYALQISIRGAQLSLPSPVPRNHQKILKPQFFNSFKAEKKNIELLDTAAGYLAKKAVNASLPLAETDFGDMGPEGSAAWGGFMSRKVLSVEVVPMLVKIQGLTDRPLLPASVAPLRMPPFGKISAKMEGEELSATQTGLEEDEEVDEEDSAGVLSVGWDREEGMAVAEEKGWLEDDEIQGWD